MSDHKANKVKAILVKMDIKQKDIAAELDVRLSTVSGVINGHHESQRIKKYISELTGVSYQKLWGKRK